GINISRAVVPALGGAIIASLGLAWPFLLNAVTFLAVIGALIWWKPAAPVTGTRSRERIGGAMKLGLRHAARNPALKATLLRAFAFFVFASAYWAFLPLIVREEIAAGPTFYGIMLGSIGVGAVATAAVLPKLRAAIGDEWLSRVGCGVTAVGLGLFGLATTPMVGIAAALLCGSSWIMVMTALNVSTQTALPDWVRARGIAVFQMVFAGSMAGGAFFWGAIADATDLRTALLGAAAGLVVATLLVARFKLQQGADINYTPAGHWAEPQLVDEPDDDIGPVLISVEYHVKASHRAPFIKTAAKLEAFRRQDGGYDWVLLEDIAEPGRMVENWREDSWAAHLRTHDRVSEAVKSIQLELEEMLDHRSERRVTHYLPPDPNRPARELEEDADFV
ncbi:MAG: MFS transporter, partial [Pseudomonadota bacterium]